MERYLIPGRRKPCGFDVLDAANHRVASVNEPGWFPRDAEGTVGDESLRLVREGFWRSTYRVERSGVLVGSIKTSGFGKLTLELRNAEGASFQLAFVRKGLWRQCHVLRFGKDLDVIEYRTTFNWRTWTHDYVATVTGQGLSPEQLPWVLALGGFCARLVTKRQAAAAVA